MASKCRNMFCQNKKQETTEIGPFGEPEQCYRSLQLLVHLFSEDPVSLNMTSNSEDQNMEDLTGTGSELVAYPQLFLDDGDTEKQSCGIDSSGNTSQTRTENSIPVLDSLVPKDS
ncbi:hypothetical protein AAG570_007884 [Ranatra chinensis]|uniref:Uncharacterized protein n=1 Tax=Ranatra chinensis TaxID=642074 RepID=A0ABD0Y8F1_9HEMI